MRGSVCMNEARVSGIAAARNNFDTPSTQTYAVHVSRGWSADGRVYWESCTQYQQVD